MKESRIRSAVGAGHDAELGNVTESYTVAFVEDERGQLVRGIYRKICDLVDFTDPFIQAVRASEIFQMKISGTKKAKN